jgi:hypothetical protein
LKVFYPIRPAVYLAGDGEYMKTQSFNPISIRCYLGLISIILIAGIASPSTAADCGDLSFEHKPSTYYGSGEYFMTCPGEDIRIRCYHYHRHWVCEKDTTLYWDRRLDSAARTACGCELLPDTAPASPATSGKPRANIFGAGE